MTEKDKMDTPVEKGSFRPNEPKATTAFPSVMVIVTVIFVIMAILALYLYR